jgi:poly(A) polymerase
LQDAIDDVFNARIGDVSGRGKLAGDMREIWMMQPRFEKRVGSAPFGLVQQERFRAAFDFMRLRADIGEVEEVLADWWQEFSTGDDAMREDLVDQVRKENLKRPRAVRAPRPVSAPRRTSDELDTDGAAARPATATQSDSGEEGGFVDAGAAPKKRRRRRRGGSAGRAAGDGQAPSDSADSH